MIRKIVTFLTITLALLLVSEAASAQVIDGCIKPNGTLKVVTAPGSCGNNEMPISWNVQGPKGDQGDPGATGGVGSTQRTQRDSSSGETTGWVHDEDGRRINHDQSPRSSV